MGKLRVIGIGPGSIENMTLRALKAIEESEVIVGYSKYIDMIKELLEGKELYSTGMMGEEADKDDPWKMHLEFLFLMKKIP